MIYKPLVVLFALLVFPSSLVFADVKTDINGLLQKGLELNNASKYDEAIPYFDQVLEIEPNNTKALILKGAMLGQLNQSQKAISYFDKVLEIDPKNVAALSNKAAALVKLGKIKESIRYSEAALAIDPNHNQAMKNEVLAYFKSTLISVKDSSLTVYVEVEVRNSKKQLLSYAEFDDIKYSDLDLTDDYLNSLPIKEIIEKDGKQFDVLVVSDQFPQNEYAVISTDSITSKLSATHYNPLDLGIFTIFYTNHDGIPVDKGDIYTSVWTIIRPHH